MKSLSKILILLLLAKIISVSLWWYLPSEGVELNTKKSYRAKYQRVDFKNMLVRTKVIEAPKKDVTASSTSYNISSLILKGLYGSRFHGYAIVTKKASPKKTTIVAVGESFAGYKLKEIQLQQVIFTKNTREYILALEAKRTTSSSTIQRLKSNTQNSNDNSEYIVTRADIKYYSSNPSRIWKDIAIDSVKKNGKITGFKVNRIKPNSQFARIGLKKGDVIIKANNVRLSSFNAVFNIYNNIKNISTMDLVVLRNNQEKEIIYEIN